MSKGKTNVIELSDCTDSNSNDSNGIRETRSKLSSKRLDKLDKLRREGGVADFNPDKSLRERKKLVKVVQAQTQKRKSSSALYSKTGIFLQTGQDLCDCLEDECPGCFYPCSKCGGPKCGGTCRRKRNFYYENITVDGQSKSTVKTSIADLLGE